MMKEALKALLVAAAAAVGTALVNEAIVAYKASQSPRRGKK